jgi:hypothetical protein
MLMRIKKLSFGLLLAVGAAGLAFVQAARATDLPPGPEAPGAVKQVKVLPDKAPDCSSLKSIAETVTRGCKTNDAKAIAIYNFMLLTHYHGVEPSEDGGVPALKDINCYGWATCGATHIVESALWRELGWGWRFVLWPGHTTVEAIYDGRRHYFDAFLKFYVWMPDGKGGQTVAGEEDIVKNQKALWTDAFVRDPKRRAVYLKNDQFVMVNGKANWQARDFLACDGRWLMGRPEIVPRQLNKVGAAESWAGFNQATGNYSTDVNLAPGFGLTNTWDPMPDCWYRKGSPQFPVHSCGGHCDTMNNPGHGFVVEPYIDLNKTDRSWGNGILTFAPDFSNDTFLKSFLSTDNVKYAGKALVPAAADKPAAVVLRLASPYIMVKAGGEAAGADKVEVSVDGGKTFTAVEPKNFDQAVKGSTAALVRVSFKGPLTALKFEVIVQNNPCALPYLSPGKNTVTVSVADPKALGDNRLVVTYAYRLGSRDWSMEQLCENGYEIARAHHAKWSDVVTCMQKSFVAGELPATFEIDCPTPKGQYPVYPRMMFLRREVLAPSSAPLPLPQGAVAATVGPNDELISLPNPFLIGTEPPAPAKP